MRNSLLFLMLFIFSAAYSQQIVTATCGKCGKEVSAGYHSGDKCPYCGVRWNDEKTTTTRAIDAPIESLYDGSELSTKLSNKYVITIMSDEAIVYDGPSGFNGFDKVHRADQFVSREISFGFVHIHTLDGKNVGWVKVTDVLVEDPVSAKDEKKHDRAVLDEIYRRVTANRDPYESKYQDVRPGEYGQKITYGDDESRRHTQDKSSTNVSKSNSVPRKSSENNIDFSGMSPQQANEAIHEKAKEVGSQIYWKSFMTNMMLLIGAGALILFFKEVNKQKNS